jgi:hypothetical protein
VDVDDRAKYEETSFRSSPSRADRTLTLFACSDTLLTFFPRRESDPTEGPLYQQADLRDSILNDVNSDVTRQCESALDMAALIALHAVTVLLERTSYPDLEIFRIFEEAISILVPSSLLLPTLLLPAADSRLTQLSPRRKG